MVNDPIADLLTRIRNAALRSHESVAVPTSKKLEAIVKILKQEGFIEDFAVEADDSKPRGTLAISLKYDEDGKSVITKLIRISKPGLRTYTGYKDLKPVLNGLGIGILSTPKGIITDKDAIKNRVGGEYLCKVW